VIAMSDNVIVLAAEFDRANADHLQRCLDLLGYQARLAITGRDVLDLMRRELFSGAVIATELALDGQPLLPRVSRLPALECLVATGPAGDVQSELLARRGGASAFLPRPVTVNALANALRLLSARLPSRRRA